MKHKLIDVKSGKAAYLSWVRMTLHSLIDRSLKFSFFSRAWRNDTPAWALNCSRNVSILHPCSWDVCLYPYMHTVLSFTIVQLMKNQLVSTQRHQIGPSGVYSASCQNHCQQTELFHMSVQLFSVNNFKCLFRTEMSKSNEWRERMHQ